MCVVIRDEFVERKQAGRETERENDESCVQYSSAKEVDGEWMCRALMAWLREISLDLDNEPALTRFVDVWSNLPAMKGGSRMLDSPVVRFGEQRNSGKCNAISSGV